MTTVCVSHNGCEPTGFDRDRLVHKLQRDLGVEVTRLEEANVVVFLGCTFTQQKENELRDKINGLVAGLQTKLVVVGGCYLAKYQQHPKIRYARTRDVPKAIEQYLKETGGDYRGANEKGVTIRPATPSSIVSISDGCYGGCTFCSIKTVRGTHRSRPVSEVMADIGQVAAHTHTVKLTGIETAGYGLDIGMTLGHLLREVFRTFPHLTVELGSLNPKLVCRFAEADLRMLVDERVTGNLHLPLQSASNRVLREMHRSYTWEAYDDLKSRLAAMGALKFSTDLIAGFPGETDEDHAATLSFLENHELEFAQIFFYESRPGTGAALKPMLDWNTRVGRGVELIAQFAVSYMRFKQVSPEAVIRGEVVLPFNSNLNIRKEELKHESETRVGQEVG